MKVSEIVQQIVGYGGGYCNGDPLPDGIDPKELVTLIAAMENRVDVWGELAIEWQEAVEVCDQEGYPVPMAETLAGHIQSKLSRLRDFEARAKPALVDAEDFRYWRVVGRASDGEGRVLEIDRITYALKDEASYRALINQEYDLFGNANHTLEWQDEPAVYAVGIE